MFEDLELDLALSEGQIYRWYGLSLKNLFPTWGTVREVVLGVGAAPRLVRFLVHPRLQEASPTTLRHLAGLAEVRRLLGVREGWEVLFQGDGYRPDALWKGMAVEYDAGEYSPKTLRVKLGAFEAYPAQIWGTTSESRRRRILRYAQEMGIQNPLQVLVAPWL